MEQLEICSAFNVCKNIGNVMETTEVTSILSNYSVSSEEMTQIADRFQKAAYLDGVPIKKLLLASELALEKSSSGQIRARHFMDSLDSILQ